MSSDTPRTHAIRAAMHKKYPELDTSNRLLYYMEIAELYGQECGDLEREHAALTAEVSRLTENQRLQNSATAAVMERAEKAEAEVKEQSRLHAMGSEREVRLMARVAELERDAGRYRWLREGCNDKGSKASLIAANHYGFEWDAAIDAARGTE